jgi:hypothetical protein
MAHRKSGAAVIPMAALLLLALVAGDLAHRAFVRPVPPHAVRARLPAASGRADGNPAREATAGEGARTMSAAVAATGRLDSATRVAELLRIAREGADTYLPAMLATEDSTLHRWGDDRERRPIRVAALRETVPGLRDVFYANVAWAVTRWNAVGLPIYLEPVPDTAGADIVVTWAARLDSNRAGRADVSWGRSGRLAHVHITLATHTPDGRQVLPSQMVALALHELGHALGLGHSTVTADALYPETSAADLTGRDKRTAMLLYSVPPGSLK